MSYFEVPDDTDSSVPMFISVAVEKLSWLGNRVGDVGAGANSDIYEGPNKGVVWEAINMCTFSGGEGVIRAWLCEIDMLWYHRSMCRVGIAEAEGGDYLVNECCLGDGDCVECAIMGDADA